MNIELKLPMDDDGFLRRECPKCEREFKAVVEQRANGAAPKTAQDTYFCPYCAQSSGAGSFWTKAQVEFIQGTAMHQVVGPKLKKLFGRFKEMESRSNKFVKVKVTEGRGPEQPAPLKEPNDMVRVEPPCHPEPVKVVESWTGDVACLICGKPHKVLRAAS